jgi:hypothetical protein
MLRQPIVCAVLLCYLAACTSWHVEQDVTPLQLISTKQPSRVRLTRADSSSLVLDQPQIAAGDSVTGTHNGVLRRIAVSDVTQVATSKISAGRTIGLFLGLAAIVVGIASIACVSGSSSPCNN